MLRIVEKGWTNKIRMAGVVLLGQRKCQQIQTSCPVVLATLFLCSLWVYCAARSSMHFYSMTGKFIIFRWNESQREEGEKKSLKSSSITIEMHEIFKFHTILLQAAHRWRSTSFCLTFFSCWLAKENSKKKTYFFHWNSQRNVFFFCKSIEWPFVSIENGLRVDFMCKMEKRLRADVYTLFKNSLFCLRFFFKCFFFRII